jgi:hypothetical protein
MKARDLEAEWERAVSAVRQPHLDRIRALGVPATAIAAIGLTHPAFGVVEAEGDRHGYYVPGAGALHVVQPVYEMGGLVDLVAWRSDNPARWYLRTGLGWLLNADPCLFGGWNGHLLTLHASPMEWLRAGANGVSETGGVVLDWDAPDLTSLRAFDRIACGTPWLAATLKRALARTQRLPAITTAEVRHAA